LLNLFLMPLANVGHCWQILSLLLWAAAVQCPN
jgi:hypothetical protein